MKILKVLLVVSLLVSCGSAKKSLREQVNENATLEATTHSESKADADTQSREEEKQLQFSSLVTDDSTEVWTLTTINWYDTERPDSNGNAPLLKTETVVSVRQNGKHSVGRVENQSTSEKQERTILAAQELKESGVSAEKSNRSSTQRTNTVSNSKPIICLLSGVVLAILIAVLAYWVFSKYRAARHE